MKRIVGFIFLCTLAMTATAQTYNNGVWYSLFDETAHTMNTQGDCRHTQRAVEIRVD